MKASGAISRSLGVLIFIGVVAFFLNRPNGFLPAWIKAITWHLSNKPKVFASGLTVNLPWAWWTVVSDTSEATFLRTPAWNSDYSGTFTIRKGCRTESQFDSLLKAKEIGGDSIVSIEEKKIVISGQLFRGARLVIHDKSSGKNLIFETYPIFSKGVTINITDHPLKLRDQLSELFMSIHF